MARSEVSSIIHFDGSPKWIALCGVDLLATQQWVSLLDPKQVTCNDCKMMLEKK